MSPYCRVEFPVMGALFSCCCGVEDDEAGEYGERTRLISECNTQTQIPPGLSDDMNYSSNTNQAHSLPRQNDETSKLGKILTDFTEDIIDISVVDLLDPGLEQQEVNEKIAHYTQKLNESASQIVRDNKSTTPALDNLPIWQIVGQLKTDEISDNDRTLICRMSKQMESMLGSMRVESTEDTRELVVGLGSRDTAAE